MGTFALMDYMGFDLNKMTLIGLTLAIGIIIDDAIVVIENVYKKMEEGMGKLEAAVEGTKEMAFYHFSNLSDAFSCFYSCVYDEWYSWKVF